MKKTMTKDGVILLVITRLWWSFAPTRVMVMVWWSLAPTLVKAQQWWSPAPMPVMLSGKIVHGCYHEELMVSLVYGDGPAVKKWLSQRGRKDQGELTSHGCAARGVDVSSVGYLGNIQNKDRC